MFRSLLLDPQQITKPCPPCSGLFCLPFGVGQGQAVASFLQPGKCQLPCGVAFFVQYVRRQGGGHDHGDPFLVAGGDDLQHVHIGKVGARFRAVVIEYQQVVAADLPYVFPPVFPV